MEDLKRAFARAALLPKDKQIQIIDFIEFLTSKYVSENPIAIEETEESLFDFLDRSVEEMEANPKRLTWNEIKDSAQ